MSDLRHRLLGLTAFAVFVALSLLGTMATATRLLGQGNLPTEVVPMLNWMSFSGVAALVGVAVQWGATRERMKDITTLRQDFDGRFDRIERQIDSLFELLGAERRTIQRKEFSVRIPIQADGDGAIP